MTCVGDEEDDPFPVDDCLFTDTFSLDSVFHLMGEELRIKQVFGANLGVAAPVWEAVRAAVELSRFCSVCWGKLWSNACMCRHTQALHLCRYLEDESVLLRGQRVIELGAGTGVVGILAARMGMLDKTFHFYLNRTFHVYLVSSGSWLLLL